MRLFSRLGLLAVMVVSMTCLTETADAQLFPIFKNRRKACCCKPTEPAPEPECTPEEPEPEATVCCAPAPAPEPEPTPVCCSEPAPAPEPTCCPIPVCEASAPEPVEPETEAPVSPCCCCCDQAAAASAIPASAPTENTAMIEQYGMPELAEGETLVSISPIEIPTSDASTTTSAVIE